jgi:hypothetical protein
MAFSEPIIFVGFEQSSVINDDACIQDELPALALSDRLFQSFLIPQTRTRLKTYTDRQKRHHYFMLAK